MPRIFGPEGLFPIMFRGTHKRKVIEVSQNYRQLLAAEEGLRHHTEREWQRERREWSEVLDKLRGHTDEEGRQVLVQSWVQTEDPRNIGSVSFVRLMDRDTTRIIVDITGYLTDRMRVLDRREINFVSSLLRDKIMEKVIGQGL